MKNKAKWIFLSTTSIFLLTGCATEDTPQEDTTSVSNDGASSVEDVYSNMLNNAEDQYEAQKFDAAAGTLSVLLQNDLNDFEEIQLEAQGLLSEINQIQADEVKKTQGESEDGTSDELVESKYQTERNSEIASQEFEKDTNQSIKEATDEEIEAWLAQKESAKSIKADEIDQRDQVSNETDDDKSSEEIVATEKETEILNTIIKKLEIDPIGYEFFLVEEEDIYQIEVREPQEMNEVVISNLIAIVQYNSQEETYQKLNSVTGEYEEF